MRAFTAIFLDNSLSAILDIIDHTPDLDSHLPGVIEFKDTLLQRVQQLRNESHLGPSGEDTCIV